MDCRRSKPVTDNVAPDNDKSKRTYSALDPKLQLWVAATGFGTAMIYRDMAGWYTSPEDQEQLLQEFSTVGTGLQVPLSMWPRTVVSFLQLCSSAFSGANASSLGGLLGVLESHCHERARDDRAMSRRREQALQSNKKPIHSSRHEGCFLRPLPCPQSIRCRNARKNKSSHQNHVWPGARLEGETSQYHDRIHAVGNESVHPSLDFTVRCRLLHGYAKKGHEGEEDILAPSDGREELSQIYPSSIRTLKRLHLILGHRQSMNLHCTSSPLLFSRRSIAFLHSLPR